MKQRILEVIDGNGKSLFYPQFRFCFLWLDYCEGWNSVVFLSLEIAEGYLKKNRNIKTIVHKVN